MYVFNWIIFLLGDDVMGVKLVVGIPGTGKNTYMTGKAIKHMKAGLPVFSTYPIKTTAFLKYEFACNKLNPDDLKTFIFPDGALIIIDEAHLKFNSRDSLDKKTSNMTSHMREFLTYIRHLNNDVYIICQMAGAVDKYFREYAEEIIFLKYFNPKFIFPRVRRKLVFYSAKDFDAPDWQELKEKGLMKSGIIILNSKVWKKYNSVYGRDLLQSQRDLIESTRFPVFKDLHINKFWEKILHSLKLRIQLYNNLKRGELK